MALIKCKECGKEISDKSKTCVNCGCPIEINKMNNNFKINNIFASLTKKNILVLAGIIIAPLLLYIIITKIIISRINIVGSWKYSTRLITGDTFAEKYTFEKNGHATYIRQAGGYKREFDCRYKFRRNNTQIKISCNYDTEEIKKKNNIWVNFEKNEDKIYIDNKEFKSY